MDAQGGHPPDFPTLPILSPADLPPRGAREKYGGLFYVGIGGLVVLVVLIAWFATGAWSLRDVWRDVYVLHDARRPDLEREAAAVRLAGSTRFGDDQKLALALERGLPDRARHALALGVSADLAGEDPRGFSLAVARSPNWPSWLRLALELNLARGAVRGYAIAPAALDELARDDDPVIAAVARFAQAVAGADAGTARQALEQTAAGAGSTAALARMLLKALAAPAPGREPLIDQIGLWLQTGHEPTARLKAGVAGPPS